ncbi:hypothetical protein OFN30_06325, partial [Escherichia coli]|nr:hypothetical protein [Escherichia coli]
MISLKAPHNNLMPYTQQSILNTVKNNQLPEDIKSSLVSCVGNDSNLLIVFYVQIMPDDFVMQLHR